MLLEILNLLYGYCDLRYMPLIGDCLIPDMIPVLERSNDWNLSMYDLVDDKWFSVGSHNCFIDVCYYLSMHDFPSLSSDPFISH